MGSRKALDAVVIAACFEDQGTRHVYLRSALRPPCAVRPIPPAHDGGLWELPAGLVEPGEDPAEAAARAGRGALVYVAELPAGCGSLGPWTFPAAGIIGERHVFFRIDVDPAARAVPTEDGSALERGASIIAIPVADALEHRQAAARSPTPRRSPRPAAPRGAGMNRGAANGGGPPVRPVKTAARPRVTVVLKRTSLRKWVEEERPARRRAAGGRRRDSAPAAARQRDDHLQTVDEVRRALADIDAEVTWSERAHGFRVDGRCDLVVTVGGDGTLLAASHGIGAGVPLLGINSSPSNSIGFFCAARKGQAHAAITAALEGTLRRTELTRMHIALNGKPLHERVLNEALFCHASPAATSRYILRLSADEGHEDLLWTEEQKSSGLWVGPAAGSTAAQRSAGGRVLPLASRKLQYVVREAYQMAGHELAKTIGLVGVEEILQIRSKMRQARIFLDGDHIMHEVGIGDVVSMRRSDEPLVVLGLSRGGEARPRRSRAKPVEPPRPVPEPSLRRAR